MGFFCFYFFPLVIIFYGWSSIVLFRFFSFSIFNVLLLFYLFSYFKFVFLEYFTVFFYKLTSVCCMFHFLQKMLKPYNLGIITYMLFFPPLPLPPPPPPCEMFCFDLVHKCIPKPLWKRIYASFFSWHSWLYPQVFFFHTSGFYSKTLYRCCTWGTLKFC